MNLNLDPKKSDQSVRGVTQLPSGTGKSLRVAVFAKGPKAEEARKAGADEDEEAFEQRLRAAAIYFAGTFLAANSLSFAKTGSETSAV